MVVSSMDLLTQILIDRLEKKGMAPNTIPVFIRTLTHTLLADVQTSLWHVKQQMDFLGWDDVELDYRTLELAAICSESEGLGLLEKRARLRLATDHQAPNTSAN